MQNQFLFTKVYEVTLKIEVNRLVNIGIIKYNNNSEWAVPTLISPQKNGTIHFISDFRERYNKN